MEETTAVIGGGVTAKHTTKPGERGKGGMEKRLL